MNVVAMRLLTTHDVHKTGRESLQLLSILAPSCSADSEVVQVKRRRRLAETCAVVFKTVLRYISVGLRQLGIIDFTPDAIPWQMQSFIARAL